MFIINHRKIFYILSVLMIGLSLVSIFVWGLRPGVDLSGGSLLDVSFEGKKPESSKVVDLMNSLNFKDASIRSSENGFIFRLKEISVDQKNEIIDGLVFGGEYKPIERNFSSVGPILGKEAILKSWVSIALVLLAIVFFVAFAFRKVSKPISSWVYGLVTILALLHDVLIPTGVFAILGYLAGFEVDTLFVTALLVILGFSVHDTIVVFDRIRENLHRNLEYKEGKTFEEVVGESVSQTLIRSLNTSLTTLLAVVALYFWGPATVKNFSLVLMIGLIVGTYSSIFIGSPLLVTINNFKSR